MTLANVNATHITDFATSDGKQQNSTIINETPVAISIDEINYAVMMITPVDIEAFIVGFLFTENIIDSFSEIKDLTISKTQIPNINSTGLLANVALIGRKLSQFKHQHRSRLGKTGCGICGIESLDLAFPNIERRKDKKPKSIAELDTMFLNTARSIMERYQELGKTIGGIHGAVVLNEKGDVECTAEDIGRHNALDKAIGKQLIQRKTIDHCFCIMTSRCSAELVQKAARANLAGLIHLASPSSLAVEMAKHAGINVVHIPKVDLPRVYA
ncbi:formate dehydrogenase accessory sulfurtransferase FdhD [Marinomonas balearica]|uniref:FdhD protein n=1 Tax=Marinomonas balearica TaxID=491947 RepID=A0A4R6MHG6_9GAMM|nr:formate dehydrogenase accessory sulfurtransferase FdhD [Marinomonas balearica]TDO99609.1 FdhD protein [Marinomonas balearica]